MFYKNLCRNFALIFRKVTDEMKFRVTAIVVALGFSVGCLQAQDNTKAMQDVNQFVRFVNEADHGMLIIHRLVELYNQELNKHIDLENYTLNNFSNADFKENIFQDQSGAYYEVSPHTIYKQLKSSNIHPAVVKLDLMKEVESIKAIIDALEIKRHDFGPMLTGDLSTSEQVKKVYAALEECVQLFDNYEVARTSFQQKIAPFQLLQKNTDKEALQLWQSFEKWHTQATIILKNIRQENEATTNASIEKLEVLNQALIKNGSVFQTSVKDEKTKQQWKDFSEKLNKFNVELKNIKNGTPASTLYKQYGRFYYFYNNKLTGLGNRFGLGLIFKMNELLSKMNMVNFTEFSHYYKIIYPERKEAIDPNGKLTAKITAPPPVMPKSIEKRRLIQNEAKKINVNTDTLVVEVFDNQEFDHDTISLNYNGVWILENKEIGRYPIQFELPVFKDKDNFLVLHAINMGIKPPNTAAIRYRTKRSSKTQTLILNSTLQESETIIIRNDSPDKKKPK